MVSIIVFHLDTENLAGIFEANKFRYPQSLDLQLTSRRLS